MTENSTKFSSSLGIKYPTLRDSHLKTGLTWLNGKRADDGAEGIWRIHDGLYDFSDFLKNHPGGADWLEMTKGTDITEAFETHHLTSTPEKLLEKYFIKRAKTPRNSPFTFHKDGFYKTLRKNIVEGLKHVPKAPAERSRRIIDWLMVIYVVLALSAAYFKSFTLGMLSGIFLSLTAIAAHNFFHQKDNFRMYYFNFTLLDYKIKHFIPEERRQTFADLTVVLITTETPGISVWNSKHVQNIAANLGISPRLKLSLNMREYTCFPYREWRVSHALSHHLHTNTINDLEISTIEPFLEYLPGKKIFLVQCVQIVISPIVYTFLFIGSFVRSILEMVLKKKEYSHLFLLPFVVLVPMVIISGDPIFSFVMFFWIQMTGSLHFGAVGLNAGHHHPDVFHDGDAARPKHELDWGIHQLDAVMDRKDITGSHFLVLTNFGDHALHHLFPTIDHGLLEHLYPIFLKTCADFGIEWKLSSQIEQVKGQFRQIVRIRPNEEPPRPLKKIKFT